MPITAHATHTTFQRSCTVCRWEQMDVDQKSAHREAAQKTGRARWRRVFPDRAARRDEVLAGLVSQPCPCGDADATAYVIDYADRLVNWRCRPCARRERVEWRDNETRKPARRGCSNH
jgi:hypothetical protein